MTVVRSALIDRPDRAFPDICYLLIAPGGRTTTSVRANLRPNGSCTVGMGEKPSRERGIPSQFLRVSRPSMIERRIHRGAMSLNRRRKASVRTIGVLSWTMMLFDRDEDDVR